MIPQAKQKSAAIRPQVKEQIESYEIKAGKGTSGGRMNSKDIVSATDGYHMGKRNKQNITRCRKPQGTIDYTNKDGKAM